MEKKNLKAYVKPTTENVKMIVNGELCDMIEAETDTSLSTTSEAFNPNTMTPLARKKRSTAWEDDAE